MIATTHQRRAAAAEPATHQIARVYLLIYGRDPDATGLKYWSDMLWAGGQQPDLRPDRLSNIIGQFMKSAEWGAKRPERLADRLRRLLGNAGGRDLKDTLMFLSHDDYWIVDLYDSLAMLIVHPEVRRVMHREVMRVVN